MTETIKNPEANNEQGLDMTRTKPKASVELRGETYVYSFTPALLKTEVDKITWNDLWQNDTIEKNIGFRPITTVDGPATLDLEVKANTLREIVALVFKRINESGIAEINFSSEQYPSDRSDAERFKEEDAVWDTQATKVQLGEGEVIASTSERLNTGESNGYFTIVNPAANSRVEIRPPQYIAGQHLKFISADGRIWRIIVTETGSVRRQEDLDSRRSLLLHIYS